VTKKEDAPNADLLEARSIPTPRAISDRHRVGDHAQPELQIPHDAPTPSPRFSDAAAADRAGREASGTWMSDDLFKRTAGKDKPMEMHMHIVQGSPW
jgi:hypothetical protein